jgi:hypothetical protein
MHGKTRTLAQARLRKCADVIRQPVGHQPDHTGATLVDNGIGRRPGTIMPVQGF